MERNNKLIVIISLIIILILTVINISNYINKVIIPSKRADEVLKKYTSINNTVELPIQNAKQGNDEVLDKLKSMSERDRMEFYFSEFIEYIENGKYQEAYNLLYPEFKDNYFKTLEEFRKYVDKIYPEFVSFNYNDIERQGYIYVLRVTVNNPEANKKESAKSQRIVIKENNFNDFVLSFQVI